MAIGSDWSRIGDVRDDCASRRNSWLHIRDFPRRLVVLCQTVVGASLRLARKCAASPIRRNRRWSPGDPGPRPTCNLANRRCATWSPRLRVRPAPPRHDRPVLLRTHERLLSEVRL